MLCKRNASFSPSGFISSEKWYWNFKMLLLELIKNVSKGKLTYLILCCQILLANFVFCCMTLAKLKIYFTKRWTVVLLGRRKTYGLCLEFCWNPHTMVNHPVVSVAWLHLIMSIYYAACMKPFRGKLVACWGCVGGENLLPLWKWLLSSFERLLPDVRCERCRCTGCGVLADQPSEME